MKDIYKNIHLYFDEGPHKYTDSNGNEYISTTTIIGQYAPKFDMKYWARKKAKEQGVTEKEILRQWNQIKDEACKRGTNLKKLLITNMMRFIVYFNFMLIKVILFILKLEFLTLSY